MQHKLDARGRACPMPIVMLHKALKNIEADDILHVVSDDAAFPEDVKAWCRKTGNDLVGMRQEGKEYHVEIRKTS